MGRLSVEGDVEEPLQRSGMSVTIQILQLHSFISNGIWFMIPTKTLRLPLPLKPCPPLTEPAIKSLPPPSPPLVLFRRVEPLHRR